MSVSALADTVDAALTEILGPPAAKALKFHIARMAGADDASALAVQDPAAFENMAMQLFGQGAAALLNRLAAYLFWSIVPRGRIGAFDYAVSGRFHEAMRQLKTVYLVKNTMLEMKDRDHIAVFYSSPFQLEQMVCHFVTRGLQNNQVNVLVLSRSEEQAFREFLRINGMDVDELVDRQDLVIVRHDELYPDGFNLSFEPILARLHAARGVLESRKKAGLNIMGTIAGNLALAGDQETCLYFEHAWHRMMQDYAVPITLLCAYQEGAMPERTPLIECHNRGVRAYT